MAARTRKRVLNDGWREKIRAGMLLNRLENHALGQLEMTATQIKAAEIVLRKAAPDLASVDMHHSGGVTVEVVNFAPGPTA